MEKPKVAPSLLVIAPLERFMVKGAFPIDEPDFRHLTNWFKTQSVHSQQERKCKIYTATHKGIIVGYISLSMVLPEEPIEGLVNTTSFSPQMVLVGKLYVHPEYRSHGIGSKLMNFTVGLASEIDAMVGCVGLLVDANNNEKTVNFYTKFGFQELNRNKFTVRMFFKIPEQPLGGQ